MPIPAISAAPPAPSRLQDSATFNARMAAMMAFIESLPAELNAFGEAFADLIGLAFSATSASAVNIGLGAKAFIATPGAAFVGGQSVIISSNADPANFMLGSVTAYNNATGALAVLVNAIGGAGNHADWSIALVPAFDVSAFYSRAETDDLLDDQWAATGAALATKQPLAAFLTTLAGFAMASAAEYRGKAASRLLSAVSAWDAAAYIALVDQATIAMDFSSFLNAKVTLGGNRLLGAPANVKPGQAGTIRVKQDATGSRTLAYAAGYKFAGAVPTLSTAANAVDKLRYEIDDDGSVEILGVTKAVA